MNPKIQEIVDYLDEVRAEIYAAVNDLSQAQLDFKSAPEEWSISEVLSHLQVVEKGLPKLYAMLLKKAEEAGLQAEQDVSWLSSLDAVKLDVVTEKRTAPERVLPTAGIPKAELFAAMQASRQSLKDALAPAGDYDFSGVKWPHPALGEINLYQWVLFVGKHEKRHLGQIERLKAAQGI